MEREEWAPSSVEGATYELISNLARIFENEATPAGPTARCRDIASLAGAKSARSGNPKRTLTNWYSVFCGGQCKNRIAQEMFEEGRALVVQMVSKVPARADVLAVQQFKKASAICRRIQHS